MLASDRPEFTRQMSVLCAGFNVPLGDRDDAFWQAFNRLSLVQVARIVEAALGPDGPEKMPTARALWDIHRKLVKGSTPTVSGSQSSMSRMVEAVLSRFRLSDWQRRSVWTWERSQDWDVRAVVVDADPSDPARWPAVRLEAGNL